ncbi:4-coumarate--CoA ligase [Aliidiomarina sedimenti]|uniref:4-coumarate--CoA ligase n=1 Tax=Aliidiomarina sedimenti TaxID=1933879 RepID=A0ABY0BVP6_9GAMM|nr:AMP-binding protein [Aliidiomarina sedimenti]RUO28123.1 4-coumarate--CoA ligase [Aliidiomarina sedimenti]
MNQQTLSKSAVIAVLGALIADELAQLRKGDAGLLKGAQWQAETIITLPDRRPDDGSANELLEVVVDSFEWMALATRVVSFFQLQSSGLEDYLLRVHTLGDWADVVLKSRDVAACDICFTTSGSTGSPKPFIHSWQTLTAEAQFFADYVQSLPTKPKRLLSLTPAHHIYGFLFSVLLPELLDLPVVRGLRSFATVHGGQLETGDLIIGFPSALQQIEQRVQQFPAGVAMVCSTGPCPAHTIDSLKEQGIERFIEVYGSTDTSGIGVRSSSAMPYKLLPRWRADGADTLFDQQLNRSVSLLDRVDWADHEYFRPQGRVDDAVSVNGVNVFPARIAEQLARHPQVDDARVRLLADDNSRGLKALLVVGAEVSESQATNLVAEVHAWAGRHLSANELPKRYTLANQVPVNGLGKEIDWDLMDNNS